MHKKKFVISQSMIEKKNEALYYIYIYIYIYIYMNSTYLLVIVVSLKS
jgi:hypothetical protein